MPTYAYRCRRCGHEFEKFQKISDPPGARCPKCRGAAERRITGGAGLLFKGGGFYITDYRPESYKQAAKREGGEGTADRKESGGDKAGADKAAGEKAPKSGKAEPGQGAGRKKPADD